MSRRRERLALALLLGALATAAGCGRGVLPGGGPAPAPPPRPLPPAAVIYYDNGGGIQDSLRVVIRDEAALLDYWQRATSTQPSPPPPPPIDFSREMVLLVGAGPMTPADLIRVDSLALREEVDASRDRRRYLEVIVRTIRGCEPFSTDAFPVAIVRVQRVEEEVRFTERRSRAEGCPPAGGGG